MKGNQQKNQQNKCDYVIKKLYFLKDLMERKYENSTEYLVPPDYIYVMSALDDIESTGKIDKNTLIELNKIYTKVKGNDSAYSMVDDEENDEWSGDDGPHVHYPEVDEKYPF